MFRCALQKSSLILLASILFFSAGVERGVAQEKGKAGKSQSSSKQKNGRVKKKPAPFQWVNPLPKGGADIPGLRHGTFDSPSLNQKVGYCIYLPPEYAKTEGAKKQYPVVYYLHGGRPGNELKSIDLWRRRPCNFGNRSLLESGEPKKRSLEINRFASTK